MNLTSTVPPYDPESLACQINHLFEQDILRVLKEHPNGLVIADLRDRLTVPVRLLELTRKVQKMNQGHLLVYARPSVASQPWGAMKVYHPDHLQNRKEI